MYSIYIIKKKNYKIELSLIFLLHYLFLFDVIYWEEINDRGDGGIEDKWLDVVG